MENKQDEDEGNECMILKKKWKEKKRALLVLRILLLLFLLLTTISNRSIRKAETSGASLGGMAAWGLTKETEGRDSFTFFLILKFSSTSITTSS